ncbi:MAG TPA: tripartite tricarboxylate transporter permease [Anaerovoracaceae bacterium]|nr:tripartite tricarboxylate transporter permease [Anaerovoracaceae bacterium]
MDFMEGMLVGLSTTFTPWSFVFIMIGVAVGILGGAMPGINSSITCALMLPFTYGMGPAQAIMMLVGIYVGVEYGGAIPAILIGTPGTPAAGATLIDGYPLRQKGQAGLALSVSLYSSVIGNVICAIVLILVALPVAMAALKFGPAEYFAVGMLGLTMIAGLTEDNIPKAFLSGALGLLVSTIGMDEFLGTPRFSFGSLDLGAGIDVVPVMMGLFAMSMMVNDFYDPFRMDDIKEKVKMKWLTKDEWKQIAPTSIWAGFLGTAIGALPGAGATVSSYLAYNQSKQMSKHPEEYGKGCLKGVAASESANNGCTGGALIPMLGLGIPGSGSTAVMLGALMIHGIHPGPALFISQPEVPYGVFVAVPIATFFMWLFGMLYTRLFVNVIKLPQQMLNVAIIAIVLTGTYAVERDIFNVYIVIVLGVIGFLMKRCKIPVAPMVLGVVLGTIVERNMRRALALSMGDWTTFFTRPISGVMMALCVVMLVWSLYKTFSQRKKEEAAG